MPALKTTKQLLAQTLASFSSIESEDFSEEEEEPQKKEEVLLLWRDLSMELVKVDLAAVRENLDRLS